MANGHGDRLEIVDETSSPLALDTIRALFTYSLVLIITVAGLWLLYVTRLDPPESDVQGLRLLIASFISAGLTFVYGQEVQTRTARQAASATAASTAAKTAEYAAANSGVGAPSPTSAPRPPGS